MSLHHPARTSRNHLTHLGTAALIVILSLTGCNSDDLPTATGDAPGSADVSFTVTEADGTPVFGELRVEGTNGTLVLTELSFIVDEIELEGTRGTEDFERGPIFLESLLDGPVVAVSSREIPPGRYDELEFEIDDVDDDELLAEIRSIHPDWPSDATIRVAGWFESLTGDIREFRVYLEAEVDVEMDLNPPLVINEFDEEVLVVSLAPGLWFSRGDGTVLDLSPWNYIAGSDLPELEVEIEDGFLKVEWDF